MRPFLLHLGGGVLFHFPFPPFKRTGKKCNSVLSR
nr:MAG TPA: hypothetical protein [Caudoviricetes sp.]